MHMLNWRTASRRRKIILGIVVALAVVVTYLACTRTTEWHDLSVQDAYNNMIIVGNEFRIILEATSHPIRRYGKARSVNNVRGYLFYASLPADGKSAPVRSVVGPIYELNGQMSDIANTAGATYNQQDRETLSQKPYISYRESGELVKSFATGDDARHEWTLKINKDRAAWQDNGIQRALFHTGFQNQFVSKSRRYIVCELSGEVQIFDVLAEKFLDDGWLKCIGKTCLVTEDYSRGCTITLVDDLNFVVVETPSDRNETLVYARPDEAPKVYTGKFGQPISVDGKLHFVVPTFNPDKAVDRLEILEQDGRAAFTHVLASGEEWLTDVLTFCRHDAENKRLIYFNDSNHDANGYFNDDKTINLALWEYQNDRFTIFRIPFTDLFEKTKNGYVAKDCIPIQPGE